MGIRSCKVKQGETLGGIAQREYGGSHYYKDLARYNRIPNASLIKVGEVVYLPPLSDLVNSTKHTPIAGGKGPAPPLHLPSDFVGRPSQWEFKTSSGLGVALEVAVTGGTIVLRDPHKKEVNLHYAGVGAGPNIGIKLPKIGKLKKSGAGSSKSLPSTGKVYMLPAYPGEELKHADFQGGCMFVEGAAGLIAGVAGNVMFLNGDIPRFLIAVAQNPGNPLPAVYTFLESCRVLLLTGGVNVGVQASIGFTGYLGYLR
jgi:hypothetical protein